MDDKNSKKVVKFKIRTHNILVWLKNTETAILNEMPIDHRAFIPLVKRLNNEYPASLKIDNPMFSIWMYPIEPKPKQLEDEEIENVQTNADFFSNWADQQHELDLLQDY